MDDKTNTKVEYIHDAEAAVSPRYTKTETTRNGEEVGQIVNASGHVQELDRNFNLISACSVGIVVGNTWAALGGSIVVAIFNGGPPGVIYEFLVSSMFYWLIAASLAELASAVPSSAGVYHWAYLTSGKTYGTIIGWFAGWWNYLACILGVASMSFIVSNFVIAIWGLYHEDYVVERWHVFVVYVFITWACCACVLFGNSILPWVQRAGLFLVLGGAVVTIVVCAVLPVTAEGGQGHGTSSFVWTDWVNSTGWSSDGFVFFAGMLNGAYAIGVPDSLSHLAEEIPKPRVNLPKAMAAQMVVAVLTTLPFLIAILYAIHDLDAVLTNRYTSPLAEIYYQATSSRNGALGLLLVILIPSFTTCISAYLTSGRMLWTLARDDATPFSKHLARVSATWRNPFNATLACGGVGTVLGCIYVGSSTAFNAFVGCFVVLTTISYLASILPHMCSRRRNVAPGPFWMPSVVAYTVHGISCAYIIVSVVIYCFPFTYPTSPASMNYTSLIVGGLTVFMALWWLWKRSKGYQGPRALLAANDGPHAGANTARVQEKPI